MNSRSCQLDHGSRFRGSGRVFGPGRGELPHILAGERAALLGVALAAFLAGPSGPPWSLDTNLVVVETLRAAGLVFVVAGGVLLARDWSHKP